MSEPRTVLVTGGNRGIGLAIARSFAAAGDKVAVTHRSGEAPEGLVGRALRRHRLGLGRRRLHRGRGSARWADRGARRQCGHHQGRPSHADVRRRLRLRHRHQPRRRLPVRPPRQQGHDPPAPGPHHPHLQRRRALRRPGQANYAASKAGLVGLARSITRELGGRGITANVVAPGFIETDMTAVLPEDTRKTYQAAIPAGRFATPRRWPPPSASWPAPRPPTSPVP
jgi:3-oxoacyl-[acyl-carrier protein] reductase